MNKDITSEIIKKVRFAPDGNVILLHDQITFMLKGAVAETIKEYRRRIEELIDSKTIECTIKHGEWWMNLKQLKHALGGIR